MEIKPTAKPFEPESSEILPSKRLPIKIVLIGMIFVAAGYLVAGEKPILGRTAMGFGIVGIFVALHGLSTAKPRIRITPEGITLTNQLYENQFRWEQIESIYLYGGGGHAFIGLKPIERSAYASSLGIYQRLLVRLNLATGFAPFNIPVNVFEGKYSPKDLITRISHSREQYQRPS